MASRLITKLAPMSKFGQFLTMASADIRRSSSDLRVNSFNADWKRATEKLLVAHRGAQDGIVFTQQTHASVFCKAYRQAESTDERRKMISYLLSNYGRSNIKNLALPEVTDEKWLADMTRLLKDASPPYHQLFRAIGQVEDGIKFLVALRADVLAWIREPQSAATGQQTNVTDVELSGLKLMNVVLRDLLSIWFSIGLLDVERVTWNSPCVLLQRVAEYESVHPVRSWADLKNRVGPRRRCFVFTHPSMPREPLVVLHVALMDRIPEKISDVISMQRGNERNSPHVVDEDLSNVNSAIFYSINSTQPGLQGIDLGHFLIKRVVQRLSAELPSMNAFSSLSPIPGFRKWLIEELRRRTKGSDSQQLPLEPDEVKLVLDSLTNGNDWYNDQDLRKQLQPSLLRACAYYLLRVKHRAYAFDPVANFHLRNGAVLWRLNWEGDNTPKGLDQSCSMMVNYRYYLNQTDEFSRLYLEKKEIQVHDQVKDHLQSVYAQYTSNL